ncbi:hypothetical protein CWI38_0597p0010, partial [Hamiltosporidium tvaerminnensis]
MGRKKNVNSKISKITKIKASNDADGVKKSDIGIQKCKLHPPAISLPPSSYTTITPPPPSQTCSNMQNSGLDTLPSPNTPLSLRLKSLRASDPISESNRLMVLRTIFDSVTADPKEWPRIVFFLQMPRNGWTELHRYYNEKFGCTETLEVLKKLAQSEMGKEVKSEENGERRGIATCLADTCTLTDTTKYINLKDKFLSKIKEISEKEIGKVVVRTRKHPNKLVDSKFLDLINREVYEYVGAHVPESITEAAYIMQAAQVCYDEATRKEKPRSAWKENIESKISKLVLYKDLLEKARKQKKLSTSETKSLKKIMREFNLNLSSNESLNVYEKKISMHESRKQFRKENRRFYRGLSERVESEHVVSRDEIVSFWSTMWNKNDDIVTYNDYLIPFVSEDHPTTFPLLDELLNIINWLPNWKAAGIDGIYNFFIKKLTTFHKYLNDISFKWKSEGRGLLAENQLGAVRDVQGAKEQALLNIALNKDYDSIDHAYLTQCIENLNLPDWILKFIKVIISKWKIDISVGPEKIMSKKIDRGILQGDSFRKLNEKDTKVTVQTDAESHSTNYLLFIDDLKLLAKDSSTLSAKTGETKEFLEVIGSEINKKKSATNDTCC